LNVKERAMAAFLGEEPDRIPWLIYPVTFARPLPARLDVIRNMPLWRELRRKGLGLMMTARVYDVIRPHVKVKELREGNVVTKIYQTPVGEVTTKERIVSDYPGGEIVWRMEHPIKGLQDYEVVKFIIEDTEYQPNYEPFLRAEEEMNGDGIVRAGCPRSPLQEVIYGLMRYRRFAIELYTHRKELQDLIDLLSKKNMEAFSIIAESPADIVHCGDNINAVMTSPKLFERFLLPYYNKVATILHKRGKLFEVHMDGMLNSLKELISKSGVDVIEGFTPPPMGDLSIKEARSLWKGKVILTNFPGSVWHLGEEAIRETVIRMLKEAAPGDRFIMGVTEWIPQTVKAEGLRIITETLWKYGKYPISIS